MTIGDRPPHELSEEFDANPAAGWVYGVLGALVVAGYGLSCLVNGYGYCPFLRRGDGLFSRVEGEQAVCAGGIYIGLGLMLHFHSFWGTHRRLSRYHEPAWFGAVCATLLAAGMLAYHRLFSVP